MHTSTNNSNFWFGRQPSSHAWITAQHDVFFAISRRLFLYVIYGMDNGVHAQASPNILRLCPPSLAPRPGTLSKHLNSHSHTLFNSFRYSPEHSFAQLSLRLAHSFTISTILHSFLDLHTFFYIFLAAQYRLVQVLDLTSGKFYSPFYLQIL